MGIGDGREDTRGRNDFSWERWVQGMGGRIQRIEMNKAGVDW